MNVAADTRGHFSGAFALLAHLHPSAVVNDFAGQTGSRDFTKVALNRAPTHYQKQTVANLQINHDLTDNLLLTAKVSYDTRDFHQSGDQDLSYAENPFIELLLLLAPHPVSISYALVVKDNSVRLLIQKESMTSQTSTITAHKWRLT